MKTIIARLFFCGFLLCRPAFAQLGTALPDTFPILQHLLIPADTALVNDKNQGLILHAGELEQHLPPQYQRSDMPFDFSAYCIRLDRICEKCQWVCPGNPGCHRDQCRYTARWHVYPRPSTQQVSFRRIFPDKNRYQLKAPNNDTLFVTAENNTIQAADSSKKIVLFGTLMGDCHAQFSHEVFIDRERKILTWVVYDTYGGCRAGKIEDTYLLIDHPGEGYSVIFAERSLDRE